MGIIVALILALSASANRSGGIDPTEGFTKNQQTTVNANRSGGIDPTGGIQSTPVNANRSGGIDPTEG